MNRTPFNTGSYVLSEKDRHWLREEKLGIYHYRMLPCDSRRQDHTVWYGSMGKSRYEPVHL